MSSKVQTFEIRVEVGKKGSEHFSLHVGAYIEDKVTKMFHIDARTPDQAWQKAEKHGRPTSCRKIDAEKMRGNIELLLQREPYGLNNPYPNAIAMDEMIWKKKSKRTERILNRERDKNGY